MMAILMVIQVFVAIALIGVVLIQRSEGGGLGIGSSQGMGAFMSGRGTANLLTRATAILAAAFLGLSLGMALLNRGASTSGSGILSGPPPAPAHVMPAPGAPTGAGSAASVPTSPTGTAPAPSGPAPSGKAPSGGAANGPGGQIPSAPAPSAPASSAPATSAPGSSAATPGAAGTGGPTSSAPAVPH
jgi:preprotein translocase subunit SecG